MIREKGTSLVEILVTVAVFSILAIITTQSILLTLRGTSKSDSSIRVRENLELPLAVVERQLHNAREINNCSGGVLVPEDPNHIKYIIDYEDEYGDINPYFEFNCDPNNSYVASSSGTVTDQLLSNDLVIDSCSITCTEGGAGVSPSVGITISGSREGFSGIEGAGVELNTIIYLRSY